MKKFLLLFSFIISFISFSYSNSSQNLLQDNYMKTLLDSIDYWFKSNNLSFDSTNKSILKTDITIIKKGIFLYKKRKIQEAVIVLKKGTENSDEKIKATSYWGLGKICADSAKYGDYRTYYLRADSIFNAVLNPAELILYYQYLIKDYNVVTVHSLPLKVFNNGIEILRANEDWPNTAVYMHRKTGYYRNAGNYYQALKSHNETIGFCRKYNLEEFEGKVLIWSYELYEHLGDTSRILRNINRAIYLNNKFKDSSLIAESNNELGRYYILKKDYNKALIYYQKSAEINKKIKNDFKLAINYLNIGETFLFLNKTGDAEQIYFKAIDLNNKVGFYIGNGFVYAGLIEIYSKTGDYTKAKTYINLAKESAKKSDYHRVDANLYRVLIDFYNKTGAKDSCINYLLKLGQLKDSINSKEILSKMQMYETNLKEKEITLLQTEQTLLKAEQQKNRHKLIGLIIIVVVVIIALLIIMGLYFSKEKAYSSLVEKNMQLIKMSEDNVSSVKKDNSGKDISDEDDKLAKEFMYILKHENHYRNSELSMDYFTELLNTNRAYLSKAINNVFEKNFSVLINELRIQDACKMLVDTGYNHLSIEGIALTVGFNSKTSFNRVFKTQTGITPSDFRKNQNERLS